MTNQKKSPMPTKNFGDKLKNFIKNNYKFLIFCAIFFFLNCCFLIVAAYKNSIPLLSEGAILTIAAAVIIHIVLCIFVFFAKRRNWSIQKIFLVVGSVLGIMYLLAIPMGRVPDECTHFWKVYSVSQGDFLTEKQDDTNGNYVPKNLITFANEFRKGGYGQLAEKITEQPAEEQMFLRNIGSSPIDYAPHIVGMVTGRILHLPILISLYLARLFGLITCIAIIYFCIKYIPILKKTLFFFACFPMTMQLLVGIDYDGMILCSAMAIITLILHFIYNPTTKLKKSHYILAAIFCLLLTNVKPVYFPICALLFFIPTTCFKSKKQKIFSIITILLITVGAFLLWSAFSVVMEAQGEANSSEQIQFILSNPVRFSGILVQNIFNMPDVYLTRLSYLEWLDVSTDKLYQIGTIVFFIILCIEARLNPAEQISKKFRIATLAVVIASAVLVFIAMYIQHTAVGQDIIEGVQTRYLFPLLITVPMICMPTVSVVINAPRKLLIPDLYFYAFIIFINLNALGAIVFAHI